MNEEKILALPENEFIAYVLQGDRDAIEFCNVLFSVSQVWDDIIDQKEVDIVVINRTFWSLLVALPANPFYQRYYEQLHPLIRKAILDWWDANKIENANDYERAQIAYVLRSSISNILVDVAYIVGGYEWVNKVSLLIRQKVYTDNFQDYIKETFECPELSHLPQANKP